MLNQFINTLDKGEAFATGLLIGLVIMGVVLGYVADKLEGLIENEK